MKQNGLASSPPAAARSGIRAAGSTPKLRRVEPDRAAPLLANLFHHVLRAAGPVAALAVPQADEDRPCPRRSAGPRPASSGFRARKDPRPLAADRARAARHAAPTALWRRNIARASRCWRSRPTFRGRSAPRRGCRSRAAPIARARLPRTKGRPPHAPPQMQRSSGPTWRSARAPAIACAAIGSLSGGKRGLSRPGASIMWPLNSTTLRGGFGSDSAMNRRFLPKCAGASARSNAGGK